MCEYILKNFKKKVVEYLFLLQACPAYITHISIISLWTFWHIIDGINIEKGNIWMSFLNVKINKSLRKKSSKQSTHHNNILNCFIRKVTNPIFSTCSNKHIHKVFSPITNTCICSKWSIPMFINYLWTT